MDLAQFILVVLSSSVVATLVTATITVREGRLARDAVAGEARSGRESAERQLEATHAHQLEMAKLERVQRRKEEAYLSVLEFCWLQGSWLGKVHSASASEPFEMPPLLPGETWGPMNARVDAYGSDAVRMHVGQLRLASDRATLAAIAVTQSTVDLAIERRELADAIEDAVAMISLTRASIRTELGTDPEALQAWADRQKVL